MNKLIIFLILTCVFSCTKSNDNISIMLNSDDVGDVVDAIHIIRANSDRSMLSELLKKPYDPRITHRRKYYGSSIYQLKMYALQQLTGKPSPKHITYIPDSSIVLFYINEVNIINSK